MSNCYQQIYNNQQNILALYNPQLNAIYQSQQFFRSVIEHSFEEKLDALWDALKASGWLKRYGKRNGRARIANKEQLSATLRNLLEYGDFHKVTLDSLVEDETSQVRLVCAYKDTENSLRRALNITKPTIECVTSFMSHIYACVPVVTNKFCKYLRQTYAHVGCAFTSFNEKFLNGILDFYANHKNLMNKFMEASIELGVNLAAEVLGIPSTDALSQTVKKMLSTAIAYEFAKLTEKLYDYLQCSTHMKEKDTKSIKL